MKTLLVLLLLSSCGPKPEATAVEDMTFIYAGSCYRYPNTNNNDVHVKIIKKYTNGEVLGEFIVEKKYFTDIYDVYGARHLKEIDCEMFNDLRFVSTEWKQE